MTPSKAILAGSGIIAASIIGAALVLPERNSMLQKNTEVASGTVTQKSRAPRFQIIKAENGMTWRLDTQTGEMTVCRLDRERLVCANSKMATEMPKATPRQLETERKERRKAERDERNEILDRFMAFFDRIIEFAQKQTGLSKPPLEDDNVKQL